ncbi:hypothetical protein DVR12_00825 [Chitinophaga silvatica]|uniref:Outer membrane protein beta-barrel domain-containing protein n=1 Tax=Chitinophaga silvatica TaxID=2282649 RepID=A0A3E1YG55_9BACT|nr:hypothetical protein [Chitinophaga silvatica]RFS26364.1 hypothetical protein DVR12_00825 [Chitinophaga silvatica]
MINRTNLVLLCILLSSFQLSAQSKHGLFGLAEGGVAYGEEANFVGQAAIGYRFMHQWHAGVGAGINASYVRHAPVFATLRYDLTNKPNTFFLLANSGVTLPWFNDKQWPEYHSKADKISPGSYFQGGIGFKTRFAKHADFILSASYAHSDFNIQYKFSPLAMFMPPESSYIIENYAYKFNQICITAGFQLW